MNRKVIAVIVIVAVIGVLLYVFRYRLGLATPPIEEPIEPGEPVPPDVPPGEPAPPPPYWPPDPLPPPYVPPPTPGEPNVSILRPVGGESWILGQTYTIEWQSSDIDEVELVYRLRLATQTISKPVTGDWNRIPAKPGHYDWTIPMPTQQGIYSIRVNGYKNGSYITYDETDYITISS